MKTILTPNDPKVYATNNFSKPFYFVLQISFLLFVSIERVRSGPSVGGSFAVAWAWMVLK
jgi:hypothetical protein